MINFFQAVEHRLLFEVIQFLPAQVVLAAFHERGADFGEEFPEERNVLEEDLLLKVLGASRNHHAPATADDGHQIRQRFPRPGARFGDQVSPVLQCRLNVLRQFELRRAILVVRMVVSEPAAGSEDALERRLVGIREDTIAKNIDHGRASWPISLVFK